jgi:hypothetical protein
MNFANEMKIELEIKKIRGHIDPYYLIDRSISYPDKAASLYCREFAAESPVRKVLLALYYCVWIDGYFL